MYTEKYNKKIEKQTKGFTLVETLVAVSILSLSILAGFTAVQNGISSSITAKNQITAFYLIQETMEYIKNVRDNNALRFVDGTSSKNQWLDGLVTVGGASGGPCDFGNTCRIDSIAGTATNCSGGFSACPVLKKDSTYNRWGYNAAWTDTNFKRSVQIQNVVNGEEVKVVIWISWTQGSKTKTFQVSESVFNRLQ